MQQGLYANLDGPGHNTPQQTHDPALAELCPSGVSRDWLSESAALCSSPWPRPASSQTTLLFGRVEGASGAGVRSEPCIPFPWSSALACTEPRIPAVFAPRSPCLWTTNEVEFFCHVPGIQLHNIATKYHWKLISQSLFALHSILQWQFE